MAESLDIREASFWEDAVPPVSVHVLTSMSFLDNCTDFMVYHRTSADDYNRFADSTCDAGWSWNALQPYFAKVSQPHLGCFILPTFSSPPEREAC